MNAKLLAGVCAMSLCIGVSAQADTVVGSVEISFYGAVSGHFADLGGFSFGMLRDEGFADPTAEIWLEADAPITTADIGTTRVYTGSAVDAIRSQLADGDSVDHLCWSIDPSDLGFATLLQGWYEDDFGGAGLPTATDLAATGFDEIDVTILDYVEPEMTFDDDKGFPITEFGLATRYDFVVSSVPAPGAIAMLGIAGVARRRRRRTAL